MGCKAPVPAADGPTSTDVLPLKPEVSDEAGLTEAECRALIETEFAARRAIIIANPKPDYSDTEATDAWYKLTDELYDNRVNPDCLTDEIRESYPGPQGGGKGVRDYHVHSPDFAFFARSRFSILMDNMAYIALVEEGDPYLVDIEIDQITDDYHTYDYPLTVVRNLRGELPPTLNVEVVLQKGPNVKAREGQIVWGVCKDKKTKRWRSLSFMIDPFSGEGGLEFLEEELEKAGPWTKGDECLPYYFGGEEEEGKNE